MGPSQLGMMGFSGTFFTFMEWSSMGPQNLKWPFLVSQLGISKPLYSHGHAMLGEQHVDQRWESKMTWQMLWDKKTTWVDGKNDMEWFSMFFVLNGCMPQMSADMQTMFKRLFISMCIWNGLCQLANCLHDSWFKSGWWHSIPFQVMIGGSYLPFFLSVSMESLLHWMSKSAYCKSQRWLLCLAFLLKFGIHFENGKACCERWISTFWGRPLWWNPHSQKAFQAKLWHASSQKACVWHPNALVISGL